MHIQVINFGINVSHEDFVSGATELAPNFASIPGLITKHWLGDEENKIYGGVYIWESKEHCEAYKAGEIFGMVMNNENHDSPTSKDFGVLEAPTKITTLSIGGSHPEPFEWNRRNRDCLSVCSGVDGDLLAPLYKFLL